MPKLRDRRFLLLWSGLGLGCLAGLDAGATTYCTTSYTATLNDDVVVASGDTCNGVDATVGNYLNSLTVNQGGTITARSINGQNTAVFLDHVNTGVGIGTFTNSGSITGGTFASIEANRYIDTFNNTATGVISGGTVGIYTWSQGQGAPHTQYAFGSLTNSGSINGTDYGLQMILASKIATLTNRGTIAGGTRDIYLTNSTIDTLNNLQGAGNASGGLTYEGKLPTNYNIILGTVASTYGQLVATNVSGQLTFGIHSGAVRSTQYTAVLQGITAAQIAGGLSGTYSGYAYQLQLQSGQTSIWDLLFPSYVAPTTPALSAANTLVAVRQSASALVATYAAHAAVLQAGLDFDCSTFDVHGMCAAFGGRMTYADASSHEQAGQLMVAYKVSAHLRFGGFIDQASAATPQSIRQTRATPTYGLFAYWNHQEDGLGLGASITSSFTSTDLSMKRDDALADTEAGIGATRISGHAVQALTTYALQAGAHVRVTPYLGIRYHRLATDAYAETASASVTSPLSFQAMSQSALSAVYGVGLAMSLSERLAATVSIGMRQSLNYQMDDYQGSSSMSGLESFSVPMPSSIRSMASASAGLNFAMSKRSKLGLKLLWQQQALSATQSVTALTSYNLSF
jgi:hypothetical protein